MKHSDRLCFISPGETGGHEARPCRGQKQPQQQPLEHARVAELVEPVQGRGGPALTGWGGKYCDNEKIYHSN